MSLASFNLHILKTAFKKLESDGHANKRVVSLGYPDILARPEQITRVLGEEVAGRIKYRENSAGILAWHGIRANYPMAEPESLFAALGYELDVLDVAVVRGGELVHDLNDPLPAELHQRYAMVVDGGTVEHCFNIGQAVKNIASLVDLGGYVMHGNPLNMFNHGFYNLNPTWYREFYETNGFTIELGVLVTGPIDKQEVKDVPLKGRFENAPDNSVILVLARRREVREFAFPIQEKYKINPTQSG